MSVHKKIIKVNIDKDFDEAVFEAKKQYLAGEVFVYPTDTIYGFGANPFNNDSVKRIDNIKNREKGKMYILLINDIETLQKYVEVNSEKHLDFLFSIWPNPVSVVLQLNNKTAEVFACRTAAFRIPNNRFCLKLLNELKMPLISTSVNRSSQPPLVEPSIIDEEFGSEINAIFYTEKKCFVKASTLIDLSDKKPILLREGKIKYQDLLQKF